MLAILLVLNLISLNMQGDKLGVFVELSASDFASPHDSTKYDFDNRDYSVTIALSDGLSQQLEVAVISEDSGRRHVRALGRATVFVLYKSVRESISRSFENLVPKEKNG